MFALKRTSLGSVLDCVAPCLEESLLSLAKLRLEEVWKSFTMADMPRIAVAGSGRRLVAHAATSWSGMIWPLPRVICNLYDVGATIAYAIWSGPMT